LLRPRRMASRPKAGGRYPGAHPVFAVKRKLALVNQTERRACR
jgi:hypothetical protein